MVTSPKTPAGPPTEDGPTAGADPRHARIQEDLRAATERGFVAAYRILGDGDQARDACQEAASRALGAAHRYDPSQPFYPWFYRILKNHCLDRLKERRRSVPSDRLTGLPDRQDRASDQGLLHDEREAAIHRAIAALPDEQREIIELRHFQDLDYGEIAAVLACAEGTVMSRLYRARKRLREHLLEDPGFRGHGEDHPSARGSRRGGGR